MRAVAREMNLSETAFVSPREAGCRGERLLLGGQAVTVLRGELA
jgi:hypothetical protein